VFAIAKEVKAVRAKKSLEKRKVEENDAV